MAGGIDQYTKLLLHCDGTDASTTFTDSGVTGHTVTANGNAQIDTAQSVFGGASALFDGTADYLSLPDHSDFDIGSGGEPFTIDCRLRRNGDTAFTVYSRGGGAADWTTDDGHQILLFGNDASNFYCQVNQGGSPKSINAALPTDATFVHIAATYDGTTMRLFFDGTSVGTPIAVSGVTLPTARNLNYIGRVVSATTHDLNGHIDEFRISKGIARWTANFTPPTVPYSRVSPVVHNYRMRRAA